MSDNVKRDCKHPRAHHIHGTALAYQSDKCRCDECKHAEYVQKKRYKARLGTTHSAKIPAERVIPLVKDMRRAGYSWPTICRAGGWPAETTITSMRDFTDRKWLNQVTAGRVVRAHRTLCASRAYESQQKGSCDAAPARDALRALAVVGWSIMDISIRTHVSRTTLWKIRNGFQKNARMTTVRAIVADYKRYGCVINTKWGADVTKTNARENGWVGMIGWEDLGGGKRANTRFKDPNAAERRVEPPWFGGDVPPEKVHVLVADIRAHGWSLAKFLEASDLPADFFTVWDKLLRRKSYGDELYTAVERAHKTLVQDIGYNPTMNVDPAPVTRMLQALACLGWSASSFEDKTSFSGSSYHRVASGRSKGIKRAVLDEVAALYKEFSHARNDTEGGWKTMARAKRNGWLPPSAWTDIMNGERNPLWNGEWR